MSGSVEGSLLQPDTVPSAQIRGLFRLSYNTVGWGMRRGEKKASERAGDAGTFARPRFSIFPFSSPFPRFLCGGEPSAEPEGYRSLSQDFIIKA